MSALNKRAFLTGLLYIFSTSAIASAISNNKPQQNEQAHRKFGRDGQTELEKYLLTTHPNVSPLIIRDIAAQYEHINIDNPYPSIFAGVSSGAAYVIADKSDDLIISKVALAGGTTLVVQPTSQTFSETPSYNETTQLLLNQYPELSTKNAKQLSSSLIAYLNGKYEDRSFLAALGTVFSKKYVERFLDRYDVNKKGPKGPT